MYLIKQAKAAKWTVNSLSSCCRAKCPLPEHGDLFLQVVTGVETGCFWYCFGDAPWWWPVWGQVQGGAVWSSPECSPSGPWTCYGLDLGLLNVICNLENGGHGSLHSAGLENTGLGLKVASWLEFQAFVRPFRETGAAVESLLKTSTKPVTQKHTSTDWQGCYLKIWLSFILISFIPRCLCRFSVI